MVGIVDREGKRLAHQKLPCELKRIGEFLAPFKDRLERLAVESTYNWYWLVDGLQAQGYPVVLAKPAKITQYSGLKHADDKSDAFFLAELLRLGILPTGYVYAARAATGARFAAAAHEPGASTHRADAQFQKSVHPHDGGTNESEPAQGHGSEGSAAAL
jgi:hypothetical protein